MERETYRVGWVSKRRRDRTRAGDARQRRYDSDAFGWEGRNVTRPMKKLLRPCVVACCTSSVSDPRPAVNEANPHVGGRVASTGGS